MRILVSFVALLVACSPSREPLSADAAVLTLSCGDHAECCTMEVSCAQLGTQCMSPDAPIGCGACSTEPSSCGIDSDCTSGSICAPIDCACSDTQKHCVPGCVNDLGCADGEKCNLSSGRCLTISCQTSAQCPLDFSCVGGACQRTTCNVDGECAGFCVNHRCYLVAGECRIPPV